MPLQSSHLLQIKSAGSFQSKPSNQKVQLTAEILNILNSPLSCDFKTYIQCNSVLVPQSPSLFCFLKVLITVVIFNRMAFVCLCLLSFRWQFPFYHNPFPFLSRQSFYLKKTLWSHPWKATIWKFPECSLVIFDSLSCEYFQHFPL